MSPSVRHVPKFLIERELPGAGKLTPQELHGISKKSNDTLTMLGPSIRWLHSYVAGDKIYCVYVAPNEDLVREHARKGGFPANKIVPVSAVIDPASGE